MDLQDMDSIDNYPLFGGGVDGADFSSPFIGQSLDFSSHNSSVTNFSSTVSPQDLTLPLSAPNSTAFTNLTSPSLYDQSPAFGSFDPSPASDFLEVDGSWKSLFPEAESNRVQPAPEQPALAAESIHKSKSISGRRKSSISPKGSSPTGRHSSVNGVSSRKRDKPLAPIIIENPDDTVAVKRARNTLAARKSRERKAEYIGELEAEIASKDAIIASRDEEVASKDEEIAKLKEKLAQWEALVTLSQ